MPTGRIQLNGEGRAIRALLLVGAEELGELAAESDRLGAHRSADCLRDARGKMDDAAIYLDDQDSRYVAGVI